MGLILTIEQWTKNKLTPNGKGLGFIPDPLGMLVTPVGHLHQRICSQVGLSVNQLPSSTNNRQYVSKGKGGPGIMDQRRTSSCTGHANLGAIETHLAIIGQPVAHHAPVCPYDWGRIIDLVPNADGSFPALTDDGAMPNQVVRGINERGVCLYEVRPTDDATINTPNFSEMINAEQFELSGMYKLDEISPTFLDQVAISLALGLVFPFATFVDSAFENWNPSNGPLGMPNLSDPSGGGHDIYCVDYDSLVVANGHVTSLNVWFANSWNETWGVDGFGYGGPEFIRSMSYCYPMDISRKVPN